MAFNICTSDAYFLSPQRSCQKRLKFYLKTSVHTVYTLNTRKNRERDYFFTIYEPLRSRIQFAIQCIVWQAILPISLSIRVLSNHIILVLLAVFCNRKIAHYQLESLSCQASATDAQQSGYCCCLNVFFNYTHLVLLFWYSFLKRKAPNFLSVALK